MPNYIDKDKAIKALEDIYDQFNRSSISFCAGFAYAIGVLRTIEREDAEPVVHAKWIYLGEGGDFNWQIDGRGQSWDIWQCSNCKCKQCGSPKPKRCPRCDAKMDLEDDK